MPDRKLFANSVTPLPAQEGMTTNGLLVNAAGSEDKDEKMTILFSLSTPPGAEAELEGRVASGETVPLEELADKYAPVPDDRDRLVAWLKGEGFEIVKVSQDGTGVYARAAVSQIEKSLDVTMTRVTKDGITYMAAWNAPSLPEDVGDNVHAIIGLQPFRQAHKNNRKCSPPHGNRLGLAPDGAEMVASAALPNIGNAPPYMVGEVLKAYDADGLEVNGKGQAIAILIDTFPKDSDLMSFWSQNDLQITMSQIKKINVKGGPLPVREGEETLDAEWASGIAPGAEVRIYASGSLRFVDLDLALDRIMADLPANPGLRQLSISLGLGETFMAPGEVAAQHQKFLRLAASGVNVFVSSGDAGSSPDSSGHGAGDTQVEYESSDPSVVGVGGTTLKLAGDGSVAGETGWPGSGGGRSVLFPRPVWQAGDGVPAGEDRLVPDVALAADPNTGAFLIFQGKVVQIGGTSWSAPMWAGFCALINEARETAGKPFLPFLNPLLYPLQGTSCFRDIISGTNGDFEADGGFDMVTGLGVPSVKNLIEALTN